MIFPRFHATFALYEGGRFYKVVNRPFDRAAGQLQFISDGTNHRIALAILVHPILEVHVYGYRPVRQLRRIEGCKVTHVFIGIALQ